MIHAETAGAGPACVLLHGWGLHGGVWRDTAQALSADHQIISIDLPGHGRSDPIANDHTLDDFAAAVAAVLPPRSTLLGWSLGGMLAMRLAARWPARIERLILVGTTPRFVRDTDWDHGLAPEVLAGFADRLRADPAGTVRRFLALQVTGGEDERGTLARLRALLSAAPAPQPAALDAGLAILRDSSLLAELGRITRPVTLIHGRRDTVVPWSAAKALQERLPQARLNVLPGAAHAPFLSHEQEFLRIVREALDG